jgi:predicted ester cyclase
MLKGRSMRRPIASCACVLALVTGAWVGQAYTPLGPPDPLGAVETSAQGATATAWRYYDAIDLLLRTADDSALRAVIAPDFVDHLDEPGAPSDRDGLVRYLASLRDTFPALRLTPQDVVAQGDRVVARLAPAGITEGMVLGIPIAGASP